MRGNSGFGCKDVHFLVFCIVFCSVMISISYPVRGQTAFSAGELGWQEKFYRSGLQDHLKYEIFAKAMTGRQTWTFSKRDLLTIIDFSQPSYKKRLYVVDLKEEKLLYRTYVAHGRETGLTYAREFSNVPHSYQSSLGFYRTAETYRGKHGYSLRLDGLETEINDLARQRAIVMHSADYAKESFIREHGRLGRSLGCPALPPDISQKIITRIKEGSSVFVYADDPEYLTRSPAFSSPSG
ncbi:MAG: murein L,D-transpeptidase catalytic domain family protein [Desulfovermiculus sp.]|nr:murein L,D-transpeptidase catalytic domain family protein [Desulfovermiculus sp.]